VNRIHEEQGTYQNGQQSRVAVSFRACIFGISVGAVASAVVPGSMYSPLCIFGPSVLTFGCFSSLGVTVKILCCTVDMTNGCQNCDPNEANCDEAEAHPEMLAAPINQQGQAVSWQTIRAAVGDDLTVKWANFCVEQLNAGANYKGCQTKTLSGRTCQKWYMQTPHKHGNSIPNSVHLNSCANPNHPQDPRIWCYTEDPRVRWQFCQILFEKTRGGTARGQRCQFPFRHGRRVFNQCIYTRSGKKTIGPWCKTLDRGVKPWRWAWGLCDSQGTTGGDARGAKCRFPLYHGGKRYHSCVVDGTFTPGSLRSVTTDKPWCYTGGMRRRSQGRYGNCITKVRPLGPLTHRRRAPVTTTFRQTGKDLYEQQLLAQNSPHRRRRGRGYGR